MSDTTGGFIGSSVGRREDERLLGGRAGFLADHAAGARHVVFVRSTEAAAHITGIDTTAAAAMPATIQPRPPERDSARACFCRSLRVCLA